MLGFTMEERALALAIFVALKEKQAKTGQPQFTDCLTRVLSGDNTCFGFDTLLQHGSQQCFSHFGSFLMHLYPSLAKCSIPGVTHTCSIVLDTPLPIWSSIHHLTMRSSAKSRSIPPEVLEHWFYNRQENINDQPDVDHHLIHSLFAPLLAIQSNQTTNTISRREFGDYFGSCRAQVVTEIYASLAAAFFRESTRSPGTNSLSFHEVAYMMDTLFLKCSQSKDIPVQFTLWIRETFPAPNSFRHTLFDPEFMKAFHTFQESLGQTSFPSYPGFRQTPIWFMFVFETCQVALGNLWEAFISQVRQGHTTNAKEYLQSMIIQLIRLPMEEFGMVILGCLMALVTLPRADFGSTSVPAMIHDLLRISSAPMQQRKMIRRFLVFRPCSHCSLHPSDFVQDQDQACTNSLTVDDLASWIEHHTESTESTSHQSPKNRIRALDFSLLDEPAAPGLANRWKQLQWVWTLYHHSTIFLARCKNLACVRLTEKEHLDALSQCEEMDFPFAITQSWYRTGHLLSELDQLDAILQDIEYFITMWTRKLYAMVPKSMSRKATEKHGKQIVRTLRSLSKRIEARCERLRSFSVE